MVKKSESAKKFIFCFFL